MTGMAVKTKRFVIICLIMVCALLSTACMRSDKKIDPGDWGYECCVIYDALGGVVNSRGVREVYYFPNSYIFEPSGSTNMLVEPKKDGYILAGWYTDKQDSTDANGNTVYTFSESNRWDFDEDRVQENMTLYARWIPRGEAKYINALSEEVVFSKNITGDSPIQELSVSVEKLCTPSGYAFAGYFSDPACTVPYDFTNYEHVEMLLENEDIYNKLAERFPQYFEAAEYVEPPASTSIDEDEQPSMEDTRDLFINKAGYKLLTNDPAALAEIRAYKDKIIEESILQYQKNTKDRFVYMSFTEGLYVRVTSVNSLKKGTEYSFAGTDPDGNEIMGYILAADLDFEGIKLTMAEDFNGVIQGNGHTIKNLTVMATSKKMDTDTTKAVGIAKRMNGAVIEDIHFVNCSLELEINPGIKVTAGFLAAEAKNTTIRNCTFNNLVIKSGKGDNGAASYVLGDLFGKGSGNTLEDCSAQNVTFETSDSATLNRAF